MTETTPNNDFDKKFTWFNFHKQGKNINSVDTILRGFAKKT